MSLKITPPRKMPAETGELGGKLLAEESPYKMIGDRIYEEYSDGEYSDLYSVEGKPAISPVLLGFVMVFAYVERLSDRQAAEAVRMRMDWKYALHLPLEYEGFNFSVLSEFRDRLIKHKAERRVFEKMLQQMQEMGLVKRRGRQRSDSMAMLTKMRTLNRVERVAETLRVAAVALVKADLEWSSEVLPPSWDERYGERIVLERLSEVERQKLGSTVGADGQWLLKRLRDEHTPKELAQLPEVELLATVWGQQFEETEGQVVFRKADKYDGRTQIQTPHDPEARYSKKGSQKWVGDKVQVTESDDEGLPHIITDIAVTDSVEPDCNVLPEIHNRLAEQELLPAEHQVDGGYMSVGNLLASDERRIDLLGPVATNHSPQAKLPDGITKDQFQVDWEAGIAICPAHHLACGKLQSDGKKRFYFAKKICVACPLRPRCCTGKGGRTICAGPHDNRLQAARTRQKTEAFRETYRKHRGGVEGTLSAAVRGHGLRVGRYVGQAKRHLQAIFTGIAINLRRAANWLAGKRPKPRRKGLGLAYAG